MAYEINYAYFCHIGRVRMNNEDNYWLCGEILPEQHEGSSKVFQDSKNLKEAPLLAVFDGMGGESCGETASWLCAQELGKLYGSFSDRLKKNPEDFLKNACQTMNRAVCLYGEKNHILTMGTTLAAAAFGEEELCVCNLGDSRIYLVQSGNLRQLSEDHVSGRGLYRKAPLTQFLGMPEEDMVLEPSFLRLGYEEGMRLLLCSDGLTDMVSPDQIGRILSEKAEDGSYVSVREAAQRLLEESLWAGGRDNVTAVVCEVKAPVPELRRPGNRFLWDKVRALFCGRNFGQVG